MKKVISFPLTIAFLLAGMLQVQPALAVTQSITFDVADQPTNPTRPHALSLLPVSGIVSEQELVLYYHQAVCVSTVTLTDAYGTIIYQETTDTAITQELHIPVENLDAGNYSLTVEYSGKTMEERIGDSRKIILLPQAPKDKVIASSLKN